MGKKKNRQNSNAVVSLDSSESGDLINTKNVLKPSCSHVVKGVDLNTLRKNFRGNGHLSSRQCSECKKHNNLSESEDIWLCLRCGSCSCGSSKNNHSLTHFETPRSDSHSLALKLESLAVWCHECKEDLPLDCSHKLHSCITFIKQQLEKNGTTPKKNPEAHVTIGASNVVQPTKNLYTISNTNQKGTASNRTKVKGLMNLGNTCFFNSVLQCLAQTPGLPQTLKEMLEGGEQFTMQIKDSEPLSGELDKGGPVTEYLLELVNDMTNSTNKNNAVLVPRKLLTALRKRCPQFEGTDQHDAHELLRHLLDVVRIEDLRRYQRIILQKGGLTTKVNPTEVAEEKRKFLKELNNRVSEEYMIRPDQVFRGTLVSELQCQDCSHISSRQERFLDLSLPVTSEKPQPPVVTRRIVRKNYQALNKAEVYSNKPKNCQYMKKNYYESASSVKSRRGRMDSNQLAADDHGEPSITEEDKKETNDADVEDNDDMGIEDQKAEVLESGYSSEKPASSRTSPTTESRKEVEGDDSACASPCASVSECGEQKLNSLPGELEKLALDELGQLTIFSQPDSKTTVPCVAPLSSEFSMEVAAMLSAHNTDSSNSLKANPGFSSPDLSTESLQDIGFRLPDHSCSSDHDSQSGCKGGDLSDGIKKTSVETEQENKSLSLTTYTGIISSHRNVCRKNTYTVVKSSDEELMGGDNLRCCESQVLEFNNEPFDGSNAQKDDSRPSSRLDYNTQRARSSPVVIVNNQTLDSNLLNKSLQNYTECLAEIKDRNSDDDVFNNLPTESLLGPFEEVKKEDNKVEESRTVPEASVPEEKSATGEMGFVLVGGVASDEKCSVSVSYSRPNDLPCLETPSTCVNGVPSDEECDSVSPDMYRKSHITLAPRYQCKAGECSVLSCLNHFTAIEMMAGNNKAGCDRCTERQNKGKEKDSKTVYTISTKRLLISSPPPVLILHLKRFQVQMCSFRKLSCHISFPAVLDIAPFCAASCQEQLRPGQSQILYSLYGVVEHSGTLHGGHYVAYVKVSEGEQEPGQPRNGTWYDISDSHTSQVTLEKVMNSQAYLLFYERIL